MMLRKNTALILLLTAFSYQLDAQTEQLNPSEYCIAKIAAATAKGDLETLEAALHEGLDNGLTINKVKEELVHLYAYCGFPRSLM
ncbi:MAG TPA: carboxymuconolactone decarboxylase, partial [Leeuwenhoekiella sp.]|nr:carboxymuconolactone decarboxylase [Leeuwenhoekiella sp.]